MQTITKTAGQDSPESVVEFQLVALNSWEKFCLLYCCKERSQNEVLVWIFQKSWISIKQISPVLKPSCDSRLNRERDVRVKSYLIKKNLTVSQEIGLLRISEKIPCGKMSMKYKFRFNQSKRTLDTSEGALTFCRSAMFWDSSQIIILVATFKQHLRITFKPYSRKSLTGFSSSSLLTVVK